MTLSIRLCSTLCDQCEPLKEKCESVIRCQNPRCGYRSSLAEIDAWEVYDDCTICPRCEVPRPSYDCFVICRLELKTQRELEFKE